MKNSDRLIWLTEVDSTNNYGKRLASQGAPHGTIILADCQTGGRGRQGRSFQSPAGKGLYLSVLWRPQLPPSAALNLTCLGAVAVREGIKEATGLDVGIKWTNDLVLEGKKLGGILTEMALTLDGKLDYVIFGVGINVHHSQEDFQGEVAELATSLAIAGKIVSRENLCEALIRALDEMYESWLRDPGAEGWLEKYKAACVTLGKEVKLLRGGREEVCYAEGLDEDFGLIVRHPDGRRETVTSGEVSVRGLWGYLD